MKRISYLLIHSIALLLVDGLVGGLALVFVDSVAYLFRDVLGVNLLRLMEDILDYHLFIDGVLDCTALLFLDCAALLLLDCVANLRTKKMRRKKG